MLKGKIWLKILLNTLLGLVLVFLWTRFVNLAETGKILTTVELKFSLPFVALFFISGLLRSLRLKFILKGFKLSLRDILMLNFLSQFLSFMIPVRAGEIAKSVYLSSQFGLPLGKTVIWVLVDRFLDFWVTLLLISTFLIFVTTSLPPRSSQIILILFLSFSLIFLVAVTREQLFKKIATFLSNYLIVPYIKKVFVSFTHTVIEGVGVLRRKPGEIGILLLLSLLAMVSDSLIWLTIFLSLGIDLGISQTILGTSLTALTFLVPAAPGYVGSAEAAGLAVFGGALGLPPNLVSAAAVYFHVLTIIVILVLGLASLYILKFDLKLVWKKLRRE